MIKNNFVIKHGGITTVRHNTIGNVFKFYKEGRRLCAYMYVCYDGNKYLYKQPIVTAHNFDPSKGKMYVTYEMLVGANELGGKTITKAGFASSEETAMIVNTAEFTLTKKEGEPMLISGTLCLEAQSYNLYLEGSNGNLCFLPGDNKLVRMLLGNEFFDISGFRVTYNTDFIPAKVYTYKSGNPSYSLLPTLTDNEISFKYRFNTPVTDVVLLCSGQPVLRVFAPCDEESEIAIDLFSEDNQYIMETSDTFIRLDFFSVGLLPINEYKATRIPWDLSEVGKCKLKLPAGAVIKSDPYGEYFAYLHNGCAAFIEFIDGEVSIYRLLKCKDMFMLDGGECFYTDNEDNVFFYSYGYEKNMGFKAGQKNAAAYKDGEYVFATHKDNRVYVYHVDSGLGFTEEILGGTVSLKDVHLFAMPDCVCICSTVIPSIAYYPGGKNELKTGWLKGIVDATWFTVGVEPIFDMGRLLLYDSYYDQTVYYYDMDILLHLNIGYGRFYQEFNIRNKGYEAEISKVGEVGTKLLTVKGRVVSAVVRDIYLYLLLSDGKILVYAIKSKSLRITSSRIGSGMLARCGKVNALPFEGDFAIKIRRN